MRVWDVAAGYLNRGSLLGEHREIHGIAAILSHGMRGYSRHPETLRWTRCEHGSFSAISCSSRRCGCAATGTSPMALTPRRAAGRVPS
jgi:hypothetical protein